MTVSLLKLVMFWVFSPYTSSIAVCDTSTLSALFLLGIIFLFLFIFYFWWRFKYKYPHKDLFRFPFLEKQTWRKYITIFRFLCEVGTGHSSYTCLFCRLNHNKLFGTVCLSIRVELCPTEMLSLFHIVVLEVTTWHLLLSSQLEGLAERIYQSQLVT